MNLQRRHFELIASVIAETADSMLPVRSRDISQPSADFAADEQRARAAEQYRETTAKAFARVLKASNPFFNRDRFLTACGVQSDA